MAKQLKDWLDDFIKNGFSVDVTNWPYENSNNNSNTSNTENSPFILYCHTEHYYDANGNSGFYVYSSSGSGSGSSYGSGSGSSNEWVEYTTEQPNGRHVNVDEFFIPSDYGWDGYSRHQGICIRKDNVNGTVGISQEITSIAEKPWRLITNFEDITNSLRDVTNTTWNLTRDTIITLDLDYVNRWGVSLRDFVNGNIDTSNGFQFFDDHIYSGAYILYINKSGDEYQLGLLNAASWCGNGVSARTTIQNDSLSFTNFTGSATFTPTSEEHIHIYQ